MNTETTKIMTRSGAFVRSGALWQLACAGRWVGYARKSTEQGGEYFDAQAQLEWVTAIRALLIALA